MMGPFAGPWSLESRSRSWAGLSWVDRSPVGDRQLLNPVELEDGPCTIQRSGPVPACHRAMPSAISSGNLLHS